MRSCLRATATLESCTFYVALFGLYHRPVSDYLSVDIWLGTIATHERYEHYLAEEYDDDAAISEFAADQEQQFYDHDFVEASFHESHAALRELLSRHSFSSSYIPAAERVDCALAGANVVILTFGDTIERPRAVKKPGVELAYLGRFTCDPDAESLAQSVAPTHPPDHIELELMWPRSSGHRAITIGTGGAVVGVGGRTNDHGYIDLGAFGEHAGVCERQAVVYRDRFGQWVVEDLGRNGLTRIDDEPLIGERTMPAARQRLTFGTVTFVWTFGLPA